MNYCGLIVGLSTFLIIGLFHPLVIKAEYHLGSKVVVDFRSLRGDIRDSVSAY